MRSRISFFVFSISVLLATATWAGDKAKAEKHFEDGQTYFNKGQYERASYHLDKAYSLDKNWKYLEYIAKTWLALENYQNAVHALDAYLRKGGGKIPAKKRKWAKGEVERLGKLKSYQANKEEAQAHFKKGADLYKQRRYEKAAIELEQAYELNPSWEFLELMGKIEAALKNYDKAIEVYEQFLKESGDKISGARRKAAKKDLENLETLIRMDEDKEEALTHYEQGKKQLGNGQYEKAAKTLELAYRLYPNWEFLEQIGEALAGSKSYRRAVDAYTTFLSKGAGKISEETRIRVQNEVAALSRFSKADIDVQQSKSLEKRGRQLLHNKSYKKALALFQKAYELDPKFGLFFLMGQASEKLKRNREAISLYKRYLKEGGEGITEQNREKIEIRILEIENRIAKSAKNARAQVHFKLGVDFFEQAIFEKAAIEFNKAYEIDPNYRILSRIAEVEAELENYYMAVEKYEEYLKEGGDKISRHRHSDVKKRIKYLQALARGEKPEEIEIATLAEDYEAGSDETEDEPGEEVGEEPDGEPYDWDPKKRFWTWIVGGVGVGGFVGAIITDVVSNKEQEKINDVCPDGVCPPEYLEGTQERMDTVDNLVTINRVLLVVGSVGVAAGITLFFVEPVITKKKEAEVSLAPLFDGENAGLMIVGRF